MKIFIPKESDARELRVPMIPADVEKLVKKGAQVVVESGMGISCHYHDTLYEKAGAGIVHTPVEGFAMADMVLRLRKPAIEVVKLLRKDAIHVSFLDPFNSRPLIQSLAEHGVNALCMEMIPRSTIAQKMDALSSQASLGGYVAAVLAAERLNRIFPMMMTPAGTIQPSRVFVIGAGVAGLQAIATAKRLGARVEAFDTRPAVAEQIRSVGARFVEIDLGETGQTRDGYAKALTEEQLQKQREGMARVCALSDVVITTAQVFGRKAPVIVTREMIAGMKPGSLIIDLAIEGGGNVEGAVLGEEVVVNGVRIIGLDNLPGHVCIHASQMYSANLTSLVTHFWDEEAKSFPLKLEDEIIQSALVTAGGEIRSELLKKHYESL
ncbi:MAG TPA: NAD(P) transhydrogenase subunit alpha [bacterium]|nr:NAD(P) transhydrogenase subunit alpha [bacterium]HOH07562.1 NAD(P) transhydrogenase subunit alpha [bacterium]HOY43785.1 NAD(P) transhydrogenase subunit alpha [bacterium]HPG83310.1 NAD(P) transhydrogenase subunit alpha [bacterium]HPM58907.1 NAD(P) transhydrogenase subunit alpha [bacterium]